MGFEEIERALIEINKRRRRELHASMKDGGNVQLRHGNALGGRILQEVWQLGLGGPAAKSSEEENERAEGEFALPGKRVWVGAMILNKLLGIEDIIYIIEELGTKIFAGLVPTSLEFFIFLLALNLIR